MSKFNMDFFPFLVFSHMYRVSIYYGLLSKMIYNE